MTERKRSGTPAKICLWAATHLQVTLASDPKWYQMVLNGWRRHLQVTLTSDPQWYASDTDL